MSGLLQPFDEGILIKKGNAPQGTSVKTEGDPRRQAIYNGGKLAEMLALPVQPIVVLSHPQGSWEADGEEGCPVLHLTDLLQYILLELPRTMKSREKITSVAEKVFAIDQAAAG